jgi:two-component system sensor histidine kinase KdpD
LVIAVGVTAAASLTSSIGTAFVAAGIAWFTAVGFSRPPYGQLRPSGHHALVAAGSLAATALLSSAVAAAGRARHLRRALDRPALDGLDAVEEHSVVTEDAVPAMSLRDLAVAVSRRRQLVAVAFGAATLPLLTAGLATIRTHLSLDDDLLLYLVAVLAITLLGGFWPAIAGALAACLLVNWYFTPPLHDWTIGSPQNLFALLLFITVAVTVSSVVHLAARRAALATRSSNESDTLLALARTVLGGDDTATDVVEHLAQREGVGAELQELAGSRWVRIAAAGDVEGSVIGVRIIRDDVRLRLFGPRAARLSTRVVEGYGAQAAAAIDRERLRVQAAQAEMLAAGNRMRTALLTAVSHDLRTPLASVKAGVSSLRQTDVSWSPADQAELLATIEENADRLDALIANLLDMSRIHTGSLQPLLRPISVDEVAPLALHGVDAGEVEIDIPDDLPLVATDPGLLERAVANLVANAVRFSPAGRPPRLVARNTRDLVQVDVVDHGPGVRADMKERIFEPFQQLGDRRNADGVGLGLAVARGFVEATGGTLVALDTPGGGLTMRIELRVCDGAVEPSLPP